MSSEYPEHDHLLLKGILDWENENVRRILEPLQNLKNTGAIEANSIDETTSLVKGADLVVSNDTGIRHVAIVSETPTVGIFFGDPYRYWPRYPIHEVALPEVDGPPPVDAVKAACLSVLGKAD